MQTIPQLLQLLGLLLVDRQAVWHRSHSRAETDRCSNMCPMPCYNAGRGLKSGAYGMATCIRVEFSDSEPSNWQGFEELYALFSPGPAVSSELLLHRHLTCEAAFSRDLNSCAILIAGLVACDLGSLVSCLFTLSGWAMTTSPDFLVRGSVGVYITRADTAVIGCLTSNCRG